MLIFVRTERVLVQGDRDAQAAKKTNGGFKKKCQNVDVLPII
jgi:hypothetical protein